MNRKQFCSPLETLPSIPPGAGVCAGTVLSIVVVVLVVCGELFAGVIAQRIACITRVGAQHVKTIFPILVVDYEFIVDRKTLLS